MTDSSVRITAVLSDRYRIERELGAGGMATVYLAEDVRHRRKVAIKVLHPELSAVLGPERFLKEIELTANLQHPHILPLFDSGSADGLLYYVMPYVDGETLRTRLERERQLPVATVIRIATEAADALEYAHKRGVIHRDIKPENILLHDGRVLVADFGIALAVEQAGGQRMTQTGLSLGTPQYMAPEQAMGERNIDARVDIYALGVVTYEMLAGEPPFTGATAQAVVARVITEQPRSLSAQRRSIPSAVDDAVLTALEKLPADRFDSAADFARALSSEHAIDVGRPHARHEARARQSAIWPVAAAAGALVLAAAAFLVAKHRYEPRSPIAAFGASRKVTWERGLEIQPALSPDGKYIAYAAGTTIRTQVYVRQVTGGRAVKLTDDSTSVETNPQWSADGSRILFLSDGGVFSAPSSGGSARPEMRAVSQDPITSAVWSPDGRSIAYAVRDSLFVRDPDGRSRLLAHLREASLCQWARSGELVACASGNSEFSRLGNFLGNISPSRIVVVRVRDGTVAAATDSVSANQSPFWSHDGQWLYFVSDRRGPLDMYAVRVSRDGAVDDKPVRLTTGLGAHSVSMSADGKLVAYDTYTATANLRSLPFPPNGADAKAATPITTGAQVIEEFDVSADGKWIYYDSNVSGTSELYRQRLPSGAPEQITFDSTDNFSPAVSPNGRELAFHSWRSGSRDIYVLPLDGGALQRVTTSPLQESKPAWSPDGNALAYSIFGVPGSVWVVRRRNGVWGTTVKRTSVGGYAAWSPDGRSIAYTTSTFAGGSLQIIDPDSGAPRAVFDPAKNHGMLAGQPWWSSDARALYFKTHDADGNAEFWSVPVTGGAPTLLTRFTDPMLGSYRPEWTVRGGRMYFTIDDRQSDVWVMQATPR
jgi:Tol biopolymer transport system component/tRNA A-37 threonylcarbamoyl transferase component Bud32